jgi:hypothetical protein
MKHRARTGGNDQGGGGDPSEGHIRWCECPLRTGLYACVVVSVTYATGSVQDGLLAVSAVAGAAQVIPRRADAR